MRQFIFVLLITTTPLTWAQTRPTNWSQTLHDALTLNSKPREKDAELAAQKEITKGARDAYYPTVSLNLGATDPYSHFTDNGIPGSSRTVTRDANVAMNWVLFQCGYRYYTYKSARVQEKIMNDQFESTQFFITNTKGNVVANSFNAYSSLLNMNESLRVFPVIQKYMAALRPIAEQDGDAASTLELARRQVDSARQTFEQNRSSALEVFTHWVRVPPSDHINDMQDAMNELKIPKDAAQAYKVAIAQSPDIQEAGEQIRLAGYQIKVAEAAFCPTVSMVASVDQFHSNDNILQNSETETSESVGLSVSMPLFNMPAYDNINYARKMLIAQRLSQESALEDANFSLQQTYRDLEFQTKNEQTADSDLTVIMQKVKETEEDIANHRNLPDPHTSGAVNAYVTGKIGFINTLMNSWFSLAGVESKVLQDKFSVLQVTGTVFNGQKTTRRNYRSLPRRHNLLE